MFRFICLFICLFLLCGAQAQDDVDEAAINEQLADIRLRLNDLKNALNQAEGEEAKLLKELETQDQRINRQGKLIRDLKAQVATAEEQIKVLTTEITNKNNSISKQKSQMAELLRLHVFINHDRILKMMLLNPNTKQAEVTQHQIKYLQHQFPKVLIQHVRS